ncbi:NADPH-dependent oxidoreductase [bacterium]|nr:NADPH-dependent oxidoreductase [bacterium]
MQTHTNPVIEIQKQHVSIREFRSDPVPGEMLDNILKAGRRAPTSSNLQAYSIIVVKDPALKQQLAQVAGNQTHVETCPVFLAFCADLHRLDTVCGMHDTIMTTSLETLLISTIDASLVGMSVQTAVESLGLGAVMIGAMRNDVVAVSEILGLPTGVFVVFGMCIGWPETTKIPPQKPRLPRELVIHSEHYGLSDQRTAIEAYDKELADHYATHKKNINPLAWSGVIARNLSRPLRPQLKLDLEKLGFNAV